MTVPHLDALSWKVLLFIYFFLFHRNNVHKLLLEFMTHWAKTLGATRMVKVLSLGPMWWKERRDSRDLSLEPTFVSPEVDPSCAPPELTWACSPFPPEEPIFLQTAASVSFLLWENYLDKSHLKEKGLTWLTFPAYSSWLGQSRGSRETWSSRSHHINSCMHDCAQHTLSPFHLACGTDHDIAPPTVKVGVPHQFTQLRKSPMATATTQPKPHNSVLSLF